MYFIRPEIWMLIKKVKIRWMMLRGEGTHWKLVVITKAIIELKNWAWEGAARPMEDPPKKTKTTKPFTPTKNIISIPIEFIYANIAIFVEFVFDHVSIPIESVTIKSMKSPIPHKIISNSVAYIIGLQAALNLGV